MTLLHNPKFIAFDGSPITGRTPTFTTVTGPELTRVQSGVLAHAYKLFCDAKAVSLAGYFVQNMTYPDGMRVRMVSINGADQVMVWTVGGDGKIALRGFVIIPLGVTTGVDMAGKDVATLLSLSGTAWRPAREFKPYEPNNDKEYLPYVVGRRRSQPDTKGDSRFHDVFCVGERIYKNAAPYAARGVAGAAGGVPLPVAEKKFLFLNPNSITDSVDGDIVTRYDFASYYDPIYDHVGFEAGPEVVRSGPENDTTYAVRFLGYNKWTTGLVEAWQAFVPLTGVTPYVGAHIQTYDYISAPGILQDFAGFITTSGPGLPTPIVRPGTVVVGATYTPVGHTEIDPVYLTEWWVSDGPSVRAGSITTPTVALSSGTGASYLREYVKRFNEDVDLDIGAQVITISRFVDIDNRQRQNTGTYAGVWPGPTLYMGGGGIPYGYTHIGYPSTYYGGEVLAGSLIGPHVCAENARDMDHSEFSECHIDAVEFSPGEIYSVVLSRSHVESAGWSQQFDTTYDEYGPTVPYTAWGSRGQQVVMVHAYLPWEIVTLGEAPEITHSLVGFARDAVFVDTMNGVFVYIETFVTSLASEESARVGSSGVTVDAVIKFNGEETRINIYSAAYTVSAPISVMPPPGIYFQPLNTIQFGYHPMPRPAPIYAPLWREQGMCPFIVYTTAEEHAAGVAPRFAMHLRLQLLRTDRGFATPDAPVLDNVVSFRPYMGEQLIYNYSGNLVPIFEALEAAATVIKFASPDAAMFAKVGAPVSDVDHRAKFYRT